MKSILRFIGNLDWLRLGIRRRIVGVFFPPDSSESSDFSVPYHGFRYQGDISNAQEWHVFFFGGYELKEVSLLKSILKVMDSPIVFDIGANLGGHSLAMASNATAIHAFEPYTPMADRIQKQIQDNDVKNIQLHRFGLGSLSETKKYYLDVTSNNTSTGSFIKEHSHAPEVAELQIKRGDDCVSDLGLDLLKIDVEGYEYYALEGLSETLNKRRPIIMMEVTETSAALFESHGGLNSILTFDFEILEICNPKYHLGLFQLDKYSLRKRDDLTPRKVSFNVLIVPEERSHLLKRINR